MPSVKNQDIISIEEQTALPADIYVFSSPSQDKDNNF